MSTKKGLGKGFGSLLPDDFDSSIMLGKGERVHKVLIQDVIPDPNQPRKFFDKNSINELSESIKRYGILQPLVVTEKDGKYMIIAGERRYHAAKQADLSHLPVLIRSLKDLERLEVGLIENMQRVDLSPIEQALSIAKLNEQFNVSIKEIASRLGKAHTTIVNIVRLLQLPDFARQALENGKISEGHARTILSLNDSPIKQKILLDLIISNNWSVRQAENYVQTAKQSQPRVTKSSVKSTQDRAYEKSLASKYQAGVSITHSNSGKNTIKFTFKSNKEFVQFIEQLK